MSRRIKAFAYLALAAALLGLSWWLQTGMHPLNAPGVLRAINGLFYVGVVLTGVGVYCRRGMDARFCFCVGVGTLLLWMAMFLGYGGMDNAAATGADTAANILMLAWTGLPVAALVRGSVLLTAMRREEARAVYRLPSWLLTAGWLWLAVLVLTGQFLGFVHL